MAYRRKRTYRRRARRPVFGKRATAAIKRISQQPVETKVDNEVFTLSTYLSTIGVTPTGANGVAFQDNFLSRLRAQSNTVIGFSDQANNKFNGKEIQLRGLRWEGTFYTSQSVGATNPGALYDYWFRFTVFRYSAYMYAAAGFPVALMMDDTFTSPTQFRWDPDQAEIVYRRSWKMDSNGNLNAISKRKFWIPLRRKVTKAAPLDSSATDLMEDIQGMQYYWALEIWSPGNNATMNLDLDGRIQYSTYFKDA